MQVLCELFAPVILISTDKAYNTQLCQTNGLHVNAKPRPAHLCYSGLNRPSASRWLAGSMPAGRQKGRQTGRQAGLTDEDAAPGSHTCTCTVPSCFCVFFFSSLSLHCQQATLMRCSRSPQPAGVTAHMICYQTCAQGETPARDASSPLCMTLGAEQTSAYPGCNATVAVLRCRKWLNAIMVI